METILSPLRTQDLAAVAQIHCLAFPSGALTALGSDIVTRYYEWQLTGPHDALALGVYAQGTVVGFCFAGVFWDATSGFLRQNKAALAWHLLRRPWLIANPIVRDRLVAGVRILRRFPRPTKQEPGGRTRTRNFGVLAIAVHPQWAGKGYGKLLMDHAEASARDHGFSQMVLTVDPLNQRAVRFYEGLGWKKTPQEGKWTGAMHKPILP